MPPYLIDIRIFGRSKKQIKNIIQEISTSYNIQTLDIPHITLIGPFNTSDEKRLINDFRSICSEFENVAYTINGVKSFKDTGVVYFNVIPNNELIALRYKLKNKLESYCSLSEWDEKFVYHCTIANKVCPEISRRIEQNVMALFYEHIVMRITLLKNGYILREYDLLLHRELGRQGALSKEVMQETWKKLEYTRKNNYIHYKEDSILQKVKRILLKL